MWGARASLVVLPIAACSFSNVAGGIDDTVEPGVDASAPDAPPLPFHVRLATIVDGESYLHVKGTTLWFEHRRFAAPGRWDSNGAAPWTMDPIMLDDTAWQPTWPDVPTPENRDCMCLSSSTQLPVGVPRVPSTTTWKEIDVRREQGIIQFPMAANDWELIVLVSDYMVSGAHPGYVIEIDVIPD